MGLKQSNALQRLKFSYCKPFFFLGSRRTYSVSVMLRGPGSHRRAPSLSEFHYSLSRMPRCIFTTDWLNRLLLCSLPASPMMSLFFIFLPLLPFFIVLCPPGPPLVSIPICWLSLYLSCLRLTFNSAVSLPLSLSPAKPKNSANVVTVQAGSKSVVVAQCEAADGKPAATIKWLTQVGGNHSTSTMNGPDGTVTVRSDYRLVPTPADDGRELTCMVEQRTQERPWALSVRLSVECKDDTHADSFIFWSNYILGFCSNRLDMHQSVLVLSGVAAPYYPSWLLEVCFLWFSVVLFVPTRTWITQLKERKK